MPKTKVVKSSSFQRGTMEEEAELRELELLKRFFENDLDEQDIADSKKLWVRPKKTYSHEHIKAIIAAKED